MNIDEIRLFARAALFPIKNYGSPYFALTNDKVRKLRELPYFDQWKLASQEKWFHIELEDLSLFLFHESEHAASFSFMHSPVSIPSKKEFLSNLGIENTPQNRRDFSSQYEMVLDTATAKRTVTPIRFDFDAIGYATGVHPIGHIHIGLENDIRLAVSRKMTPTSFLLFIMRHMYPDSWRRLIGHQESRRLESAIRSNCQVMPEEYWQELDRLELYLS
jgi:hypothetical protein